MKFLIICALVGYTAAGVIVDGGLGVSRHSRSQDVAGNYAFSYDESHSTGGTFRQESGNALGQVTGSYGLRDADGRNRIVHYIADAGGYRASILTNEPGVDGKPSANVDVNLGAPATGYIAAPGPLLAPAPAPAPALTYAHSVPLTHTITL